MKLTRFAALLMLPLTVTACNNLNPFATLGTTRANHQAVEGTWKDSSGMLSTFRGGYFETKTNDTHEKLAEGSYRLNPDQTVAIKLRSLVRGTVSDVRCSMGSFGRSLTCTPENGSSFTLRRV